MEMLPIIILSIGLVLWMIMPADNKNIEKLIKEIDKKAQKILDEYLKEHTKQTNIKIDNLKQEIKELKNQIKIENRKIEN